MKGTATVLLLLFFCHSCSSQTNVSAGPCEVFKLLENIEDRQPSILGKPIKVDDSKLTTGWYGIPENWELLDSAPSNNRCGTRVPIYRSNKVGDNSEMCHRLWQTKCYRPFHVKTRMCGSREIMYLTKTLRQTGYCFVKKVQACDGEPCANGGRCTPNGNSYNCTCATGFTGQNCTDCTQQQRDILIMEDSSRSIGKASFEKVRLFEQRLVHSFNIKPTADNVAYMVFSTNARVVFSLREYSNSKSRVLAALKNHTYESGIATNIDEAINLAVDSVFTPSNGDRPNATNVIIMFTDGYDTETEREVINYNVHRLHATAEVFVVTLSNEEAHSSVNSLASKPGNIFPIGFNAAVSSLQARLTRCH